MKIVGLEGINDPQSLRAEVDRGARFVIYTYCFSLLIVSFKRGSDIYFIRPGQSAVLRGLPFTLISFFFGWWGFPWGLIYTIESLVKNLGGGTDVTQAVMADLVPENTTPPPLAVPPPLPLRGDPAPPPALPPAAPQPASAEPRAAIGLGSFRLAAIAAAIAAIAWIGVAVHRGGNVQTALVNGLSTSVTLTLDGKTHTLAPNAATTITLAEGVHSFSWTRPDGRVENESFTLRSPFWTRPLQRTVAVINPDRSALVYHETTRYFPTDQTMPDFENRHELHAGRALYTFPAADYFFEPFPGQISLSGKRAVDKTRYAHAAELIPAQRLFALAGENNRADAVRALAFRLGDLLPDDEIILHAAPGLLEPDDIETFFASHLADQPLRLEWHRAYQHHLEYKMPERDLQPFYRKLAAENPADGAAAYLIARIERDTTTRRAYLRQAASAEQPCAYAHNSLAYEALGEARFADALAHLRDAEKGGLASLSFEQNRRDILLANRLDDEALKRTRDLLARDSHPGSPTRTGYVFQELAVLCRRAPADRSAETALVEPYLKSLEPFVSPEQLKERRAELAALAAYARGDEAGFAAHLGPYQSARFAVAISRGRAAEAAAALAAQPRSEGSSWLLVYLAAREAGDTTGAEDAFQRALAAFETQSRDHRFIAARLRAGDATPGPIFEQMIPVNERCILAAALGHRFPEHRATYHALATKLNFKPEFPALFLTRQLGSSTIASL